MGCDIHVYKEKRIDGQWVSTDKWENDGKEDYWFTENAVYSDRNYDLFALLAGVRGDFPVSWVAKGEPEDASPEVARVIKNWDSDGHNHSHLTLKELKEKAVTMMLYNQHQEYPYAYEGLKDLISGADDGVTDPADQRVVFFFDN